MRLVAAAAGADAMNVGPSGPATGQRVVSGSKRRKVPARTGTSLPWIRQWPEPGGSSYQLIPNAWRPSSRRTNRTAPPGHAPSISSTFTIE